MEKIEENKVMGGASELECLTRSNFQELKNLIQYITVDLLPQIGRLESTVEDLNEQIQQLKQKRGSDYKTPKICLAFSDEDSDSD